MSKSLWIHRTLKEVWRLQQNVSIAEKTFLQTFWWQLTAMLVCISTVTLN